MSTITEGATAPPHLLPAPPLPRLFYRPREIVQMTGISRSEVYRAIASGEIHSCRRGRAVLVPVGAVESWISAVADAA